MALLKQREIDRIYNALRPRLGARKGGVYSPPTVTIPPHTHGADQINSNATPNVAATNVQAAIEELDSEKLARDGSQTMLGNLDMDDNEVANVWNLTFSGGIGDAVLSLVRTITMTGLGLIEAVRRLDFTGSAVGEGVIDQARVIHMAGDDADDEARIDGLDRVVFNKTDDQGVIQDPSVVLFNPGVSAATEIPQQEGAVSWDNTEHVLVALSSYEGWIYDPEQGWQPADVPVQVPVGWSMFLCTVGGNLS